MLSEVDQKIALCEFVKGFTAEHKDTIYLFLEKSHVKGIYMATTCYHNASPQLITKFDKWFSELKPTKLRSQEIGSYFYLVEKVNLIGRMDRDSLLKDFLSPWDQGEMITTWTRTKQDDGLFLIVAESRHHLHRNYIRYITYLTASNGRLQSNVLYQYVVAPENGEQSVSGSVSSSQKRKAGDTEATEPKRKRSGKNADPIAHSQQLVSASHKPELDDISDAQNALKAIEQAILDLDERYKATKSPEEADRIHTEKIELLQTKEQLEKAIERAKKKGYEEMEEAQAEKENDGAVINIE